MGISRLAAWIWINLFLFERYEVGQCSPLLLVLSYPLLRSLRWKSPWKTEKKRTELWQHYLVISRARHLGVFRFKGIFGVVDKSLLEKEGSRVRLTLKELVSDDLEFKGWIISAPKGKLIPSVPSRLDVSSNYSKLGLLSWLERSERWRGLQKFCWSMPASKSESKS